MEFGLGRRATGASLFRILEGVSGFIHLRAISAPSLARQSEVKPASADGVDEAMTRQMFRLYDIQTALLQDSNRSLALLNLQGSHQSLSRTVQAGYSPFALGGAMC